MSSITLQDVFFQLGREHGDDMYNISPITFGIRCLTVKSCLGTAKFVSSVYEFCIRHNIKIANSSEAFAKMCEFDAKDGSCVYWFPTEIHEKDISDVDAIGSLS